MIQIFDSVETKKETQELSSIDSVQRRQQRAGQVKAKAEDLLQ